MKFWRSTDNSPATLARTRNAARSRAGTLTRRLAAVAGAAVLMLAGTDAAYAVGTSAGKEIANTAQATFDIGGVAQTPVASAPAIVYVDELLDATVVFDNAGPVAVSSPQTGAIMQFTLTNSGNGTESFRLIADDSIAGADFDPVLNQIYLESNGLAGLQTGPGGDDPYVIGSNDPQLAADAVQVVYVEANIPINGGQNDQGLIQVRAISNTLYGLTGLDDPNAPGYPAVGTPYVGAGDLDDTGGGNVTAVVGTSNDITNLVLRGEGAFQVSAAVVALAKATTNRLDPFGGTTLVPGTILTYQIDVTVNGGGTAESLVVTDALPADLEYQTGTLVVSALPAGEDQDDDFAPIGTDNTGFDTNTDTLSVNLGDVIGGGGAITIEFQAMIR